MSEKQFAKQLTEKAINFSTDNVENSRPTIIIDKEEYKEYNFALLKQELEKLGFTLSELKDAPEPYNSFHGKLRNKLIAYKL